MSKADTRRALRTLTRMGFTMVITRGGHYRITAPDGEIYHTGVSPSDRRVIRHVQVWARHHGLPRDVSLTS